MSLITLYSHTCIQPRQHASSVKRAKHLVMPNVTFGLDSKHSHHHTSIRMTCNKDRVIYTVKYLSPADSKPADL